MALASSGYDRLWKQAQRAQESDLPKEVVDISSQIMDLARTKGDHGQFLKALLLRNTYRERLEPKALEKDRKELDAIMAEDGWDELDKAVLSSLAAESYGGYLQNQYYIIRQRTPLEDESDLPLEQMSAPALKARVISLLKSSLHPSTLLLDTSDKEFMPLVEQDKMSGYFNHDFYHLLARRALSLLDGLESLGQDREEVVLLRDSISQDMVTQYERRGQKDAHLLSLLEMWQRKRGGMDEQVSFYDSLLERFEGSEALGQVYLKKASHLESMGRYAQALETAREGLEKCASHKPVRELENLRNRILLGDLQISFDSSCAHDGELQVHIGYRNLQGVSLKLFRTSDAAYPDPVPNPLPEAGKEKPVLETLISLSQVHPMEGVEKEDLPYSYSDTTVCLPLSLKPGVYLLEAVPMGGKGLSRQLLKAESHLVSISNLAVMSMNTQEGLEVRVLERGSGHPVPMAKVTVFKRASDERTVLFSDADGKVLLPGASGRYAILAQKDDDLAMIPEDVYASKPYVPALKEHHEVTLLTDRSLYRPSQMVHFKGVAYTSSASSAYVREGETFKVVLRDASYQILDSREVTTGDMGSFSGSFLLPSSLMSGLLSISLEDGSASTPVRVETYQRPAFEILFDEVSGIFRLGDGIKVTGKVLTYSGEPLPAGSISYRISSSGRYDFRFGGKEMETADTLTLDREGRFSIPVRLTAEWMNLEVTAWDVTNTSEQASLGISASDSPLRLSGALEEMLDRDRDLDRERLFTLTNTQGTKVDAPVGYVLYRLRQQDRFQEAYAKDSVGVRYREGWLVTNRSCSSDFLKDLPSGGYLLVCRSREGEELLKRRFLVYSSQDERLECFIPLFFRPLDQTFDEGHPARLLLGTSYENAMVFLTLYSQTKQEYTRPVLLDNRNQVVEIPYQDDFGQGITVVAAMLKNGQVQTQRLSLNKTVHKAQIRATWEQFTDHTQPAAPLSWSLRLTDEDGQMLEAEMLGLIYDASLDAIYHRPQSLTWHPFVSLYASRWMSLSRSNAYLSFSFPMKTRKVPVWGFDHFFDSGMSYYPVHGPALLKMNGARMMSNSVAYAAAKETASMADTAMEAEEAAAFDMDEAPAPSLEYGAGDAEADLAQVTLRDDFSETGFFMPHLRGDAQGLIRMEFTAPEKIGRWRFNGFVHTRDMATLFLDTILVTQKDFSVEASLPRFAYQGDELSLPVALTNRTKEDLKGTLEVTLFDLDTEKTIQRVTQDIRVAPEDRLGAEARLFMPAGINSVGVMVRGRCGGYSDGERHAIALLENSQRVEDAYGILLHEEGRYKMDLDTIVEREGLRNLTVEYTGNPSYLALQSLASLAQSQGRDAVRYASRLFSDFYLSGLFLNRPDVMEHFRSYAGKDGALSDPLSSRSQIKDILLEESPWADASRRSEEAVAHALDLHGLLLENADLLRRLEALQDASGGWSWFEGMSANAYITREVATMMVRMLDLTKDMTLSRQDESWIQSRGKIRQLLDRSMTYLDESVLRQYQHLMESSKNENNGFIGEDILEYLLLNQMQNRSADKKYEKAVSYFIGKLPDAIKDADVRRKALLARIFQYQGDMSHSKDCLESLKQYLITERSMTRIAADEKRMGSATLIDRHLSVMEALEQDPDGMELLEGMRFWLLLEKKSNAWLTPQLTVRAAARLLDSGESLGLTRKDGLTISFRSSKSLTLSPDDLSLEHMSVSLDQDKAQDARGIQLDKKNPGVSWGTVYWSRTLPLEKVEDSKTATGVRIERQLLRRVIRPDGTALLKELREGEPVNVRDQIVSRLLLHLDRDMDFIFVKDPLGAAFDPQEKISRYRRLDGAGCYMELKDASVNFYFDALGKGDYVIEHASNVSKEGVFHVGAPVMECVYDPSERFHGHGEMLRID